MLLVDGMCRRERAGVVVVEVGCSCVCITDKIVCVCERVGE